MQELIEQAYRRKLKKYGGDVSDELAMLLIEEATKEVILMEAVSSGKEG